MCKEKEGNGVDKQGMPFDEEGCNEKEGKVEHKQGIHNCVYLIAMSCFLHQHFHVTYIYTSKIQLLNTNRIRY